METIKSLIVFHFLFISFPYYESKNIKKINFKENESSEYENIFFKQNSTYSHVCKQVQDNFNFIGMNAMDLYKLCEGKYDLLGKNDSKITNDQPICFKNLNDFFCKFHLKYDHEKNNKNTEKILSKILEVIKVNFNLKSKNLTISNFNTEIYDSPCFKNSTFKIFNSSTICEETLKANILDKFPFLTIDYSKVPIYVTLNLINRLEKIVKKQLKFSIFALILKIL